MSKAQDRDYKLISTAVEKVTAERDALRARIAELEANIVEADSMTNIDRQHRSIDEAELAIVRMASEGRDAIDRLAKLESASVVTPRQCRRECWRNGWNAAIEVSCLHVMNEICKPGDITTVPDRIISTIRAMQPSADCGDCNPLKPYLDAVAVIDMALDRGYTLIGETPLDSYGREVLEAIKADIQNVK